MADDALTRLRGLLAGASEAPWQWLDSGGEPDQHDELQDGRGEMVASGFRDDLLSFPGVLDGREALTDGRLCAEARNALPALLAVAEALQAATFMVDGVPHYRTQSGVPQQMPSGVRRVVARALRALDEAGR